MRPRWANAAAAAWRWSRPAPGGGSGQLALHWQPKVDIDSWRIVGAEALLRWQHPELGAVTPGEFIGVAEQAGLIDEIGHWALLQACQAAAGPLAGLWCRSTCRRCSCAMSTTSHACATRCAKPGWTRRGWSWRSPNRCSWDDAEGMLEKLHALRSLGVRIALDDFGTGYSSLAYLRRFPFDTLKIDRAFVSEVLLRKDARAIVQTIAQMAATLGMRTVSEGVESAPQLAAVAQAGCDEVQGYLVAATSHWPACWPCRRAGRNRALRIRCCTEPAPSSHPERPSGHLRGPSALRGIRALCGPGAWLRVAGEGPGACLRRPP
jgi:EAL domain-containing protein (putative c-di-GMP-specific phosphodiesterase class I)